MARYEGMEELLQRVRQQLKVEEATPGVAWGDSESAPPEAGIQTVVRSGGEQAYADMLEQILLQIRDADQLRDLLRPEQVRSLGQEQHADLVTLLRKLIGELQECEARLQKVAPQR